MDDRSPDADRGVSGDEGDQEGRDTHAEKSCDQRRLATDPIAIMTEDRGADRPRRETDEVGAESQQRGGGRVRIREIELAEDQSRSGPIEEEIIPFDGGADRGGNHRLAQLPAMILR